MKVLVTGGAGYIGSHSVRLLLDKGYDVVIIDNFSTCHYDTMPKMSKFYKVDLGDIEGIKRIFKKEDIDAVIHFAGFIEARESMVNPKLFYRNNVANTINLLDAMLEYNVKNIIFSSSAAIFGIPKKVPIKEDAEKDPINVYGRTKLIIENILSDYDIAYKLKSISLRYFNASGAAYGLGENHKPETHLIPLALQVAIGKKKNIQVYGTDYPTKDGTCIRDYIHVVDLANAHVLAFERLKKVKRSEQYNLGSGNGYSVMEVINLAREITKRNIPMIKAKKRAGEPPVLIADSSKISRVLGWKPRYFLKDTIKSSWDYVRTIKH